MKLLNTRLISHPMNWITIMLMIIIAGIFGHLLLTMLEQEPARPGVPAAGYTDNQLG